MQVHIIVILNNYNK